MNPDWTLWDYLTLAGCLLLVFGYLLVKIRQALSGQGGCGSCGKGCCSAPAQAESQEQQSIKINEIKSDPSALLKCKK
jgi:hypothetical protein